MTKIPGMAVVLNAHENSAVFRDTLDSIRKYWTEDVMVVYDAKGKDGFSGDIDAFKLEGLYHGKNRNPYRNVCLGLMKAWEKWGSTKSWFCYIEYDCLVCSSSVIDDLKMAESEGIWMMGNDHRTGRGSASFFPWKLDGAIELHYMLGCCVFLHRDFMSAMAEDGMFVRFLEKSNFGDRSDFIRGEDGQLSMAYDFSEWVYPTAAVRMGGKVRGLARWQDREWSGDYERYPMRFRPNISGSKFKKACVIHPLKDECEVRAFHRWKRSLTMAASSDSIIDHGMSFGRN